MPALESLKSRPDFRRVRTRGRKGRSDGIVVFALPSDRTRLGLAVPKARGGAVIRNRARRRVREACRAQEIGGYEVVVAAGEEAAELHFQELVTHLRRALRAAGATPESDRLGARGNAGATPESDRLGARGNAGATPESDRLGDRGNAGPPRTSPLARLLLAVIWVYRTGLSPLVGRHCRYHPTCSAYAAEAIRRFGAVRGGTLAVKRVARCHPWAEGGVDPVPAGGRRTGPRKAETRDV